MQKGDFIGRSELLRLKESHAELTRRCVHLIMRDHDTERDPFPHGDEPIYRCATRVHTLRVILLKAYDKWLTHFFYEDQFAVLRCSNISWVHQTICVRFYDAHSVIRAF